MHYLIFIPNKMASNRQNLIDAGLGDLLREGDEMPACADLIGPGPGDLPGQVWTWGDGIPAYLPDRQTWTPSPDGKYWVGVHDRQPPLPEELLRRFPVDGLTHQMADGREWMLPSVFRLPAVFGYDATGKLAKVPHARYSAFCDECGWAIEEVINGLKGNGLDWARALRFCVMALGMNYRINEVIAVQLGLFNEAMLPTVMTKVTDVARVYGILDDLKKRTAVLTESGAESSSGPEA